MSLRPCHLELSVAIAKLNFYREVWLFRMLLVYDASRYNFFELRFSKITRSDIFE